MVFAWIRFSDGESGVEHQMSALQEAGDLQSNKVGGLQLWGWSAFMPKRCTRCGFEFDKEEDESK